MIAMLRMCSEEIEFVDISGRVIAIERHVASGEMLGMVFFIPELGLKLTCPVACVLASR